MGPTNIQSCNIRNVQFLMEWISTKHVWLYYTSLQWLRKVFPTPQGCLNLLTHIPMVSQPINTPKGVSTHKHTPKGVPFYHAHIARGWLTEGVVSYRLDTLVGRQWTGAERIEAQDTRWRSCRWDCWCTLAASCWSSTSCSWCQRGTAQSSEPRRPRTPSSQRRP